MSMKKGQAAMEFLMTYGWAILVVLAAIGALAYFGVLSPDRFLPSKCTLAGGFSCTEYKVDGSANTVQMKIQNNMGQDVENVTVTLSGKGANSGCPNGTEEKKPASGQFSAVNGDFLNGGSLITWSCTGLSGSKYQGDVDVVYTISGQTVNHTETGSIVSDIE